METFLRHIAGVIKEFYPGYGSRLGVVTPNRRAGLFLKRHIAELERKPVWAPNIISIEDFTARITGYSVPEPLEVIFGLYEAHRHVEPASATTFDEFSGWGKAIASDFEDIDQYLVNQNELFKFLNEVKAMEAWNSDGQELTGFQKNYLRFYGSLAAYYDYFRSYMLNRRKAWSGLNTRMIAQDPDGFLKDLPWEKIIFAGFNALSPAESVIFNYLADNGTARIEWDADSFYVSESTHEAGMFIRSHLANEKLKNTITLSDHFAADEKQITLVPVPRNTGQVKYAGYRIKQLVEEFGQDVLNETAIVLADEGLLLPLLNSIPDEAGRYNVTMGYPVKYSSLFNLINSVFELHLNAKTDGEQVRFYYKDILQLVNNPLITRLAGKGNDRLHELSARMAVGNQTFYSRFQVMEGVKHTAVQALFDAMGSPRKLIGAIRQLLEWISETQEETDAAEQTHAENEILFTLWKIVMRLDALVAEHDVINQHRTLHKIFAEACNSMPVAFYGEPLKGLQVMGLLETRLLDFRHLIVLSVNENTLPARKANTSFIPFDVRREFRMPTHREKEAVFAYHFYRLLQRAEDIHLVYNSESDALGGGEKSRFIAQIEVELPRYNNRIAIKALQPADHVQLEAPVLTEVPKTDALLDRLREYLKRGISPSLLTDYLQCTLRFYYKKDLKLAEAETVSDAVDDMVLGNVIHKTLEILYLPVVGRNLTADDIEGMKLRVDKVIGEAFASEYPEGIIHEGYNKLIHSLVTVWIDQFLKWERARLQDGKTIRVLVLERGFDAEIELPGKGVKGRIYGKVDRIEECDEEIFVIDFKTGSVKAGDLDVKDIRELFNPENPVNAKALQLMTYRYLASRDPEMAHKNITAGIISFRTISQGILQLNVRSVDWANEFHTETVRVMNEILDGSVPFRQTADIGVCKYCPFVSICHVKPTK